MGEFGERDGSCMRRVVGGVVLVLGSMVAATPGAGAVGEDETWTSKAEAVFTTCTASTAVGAHCDAWTVTATKITDPDGSKSMLVAAQFDMTKTATGFTRKLKGSGSARATVTIDSKLVAASSKATISMLGNCTASGCTRSNLAVELKLVGTGAVMVDGGVVSNPIGTCRSDLSWDSKKRAATATGKIGVTAMTATSVISAPLMSIYHEENEVVC